MSLDYIRRMYGVPAKRGRRIRYTDDRGGRHEGTIVAARDAKLRVKMDGYAYWHKPNQVITFHPTWNIEYL